MLRKTVDDHSLGDSDFSSEIMVALGLNKDSPTPSRSHSKERKTKSGSVTITKALKRYVEHIEAEGASDRHVTSVKSRIGRLVTDHGEKLVASIDEGTFADWLNGLRGTRADKAGDKLTLTTRDNLKKTRRTFFAYCIGRGWASTNPVPLTSKKRTRLHRIAKRKAPAIMLPEDVKKFLHKIEEVAAPILPFWLVKFFAGIRDAEGDRMDWKMIDLKSGFIHLPAAITKTGDARKVKMEPQRWTEIHKAAGQAKKPTGKPKRGQERRGDRLWSRRPDLDSPVHGWDLRLKYQAILG